MRTRAPFVLVGIALLFAGPQTGRPAQPRQLTLAERVAYQYAIEEVYWRHRIWPKENQGPKPSLDAVMSPTQIEKKVNDYLRNSQLLAEKWQRPITPEQLQAELERMARDTRQPEMLREIFAALGNDPFVIAECLARTILAQRLAGDVTAHKNSEAHRISIVVETEKPANTLPQISVPVDCADDTWTATSLTNAPAARADHTAVWTGSEMIVWGGNNDNVYFNTGGKYNPSTDSWAATSTTDAPAARGYHTAVWTGSQMIVWGGADNTSLRLNSGGKYNPSTDSWITTTTTDAPDARNYHSVVWTGNEMIVWGGNGSAQGCCLPIDTGGKYNPDTDTWSATSITNAPAARLYHTAVWTGTEMIVWGGHSGADFGFLNTGGRYNPTTDSWIATTTDNAPTPRRLHTAVWSGEMIVWGGYYQDATGDHYLNSGGRYNPTSDSWVATSTTNVPTERFLHTAVWTGSQMIIWGGFGQGYLNTGGRYNAGATNTWTPTNTGSAPTARGYHSAVWTGSEMIVWGGDDGGSYLNIGGRYCAVPMFSISGTVTYCVRVVRPVPFVTLNLSGNTTGSTTTDYAGVYTLSSVHQGGPYVVTPTPLRDLQPVIDPSPDTGDALKVQAHLQSGGTLLTGCAELAAHNTGHATVDIGDALAIQRFVINAPRPPSNLTGQWRFVPASRSYPTLISDQSAQNYDAYVLGDVTGRVIFPMP